MSTNKKDQITEVAPLSNPAPHYDSIIPHYDFSDDELHADVTPTIGELQHFLEVTDIDQ